MDWRHLQKKTWKQRDELRTLIGTDTVEPEELKSRNIKGAKPTDLVVNEKETMMGGKEEPQLILYSLFWTWNKFDIAIH